MSDFFIVALCALATTLDVAAQDLAPLIGKTPYEARLRLSAGMPAIVMTTPDRSLAVNAGTVLRERGHDVVAFDGAAVTSNADMIHLRRFVFGDQGMLLYAISDERVTHSFDYDNVAAIFRAMHRSDVNTTTEVSVKKLSVGRAVLTGGLMFRKRSTETHTSRASEREQAIYIFPRAAGTPWILRATEGRYPAELGVSTSLAGFEKTIATLRARAPHAHYDDRLMRRQGTQMLTSSNLARTSSLTASSDPEIDILAHVLAMVAARPPS